MGNTGAREAHAKPVGNTGAQEDGVNLGARQSRSEAEMRNLPHCLKGISIEYCVGRTSVYPVFEDDKASRGLDWNVR